MKLPLTFMFAALIALMLFPGPSFAHGKETHSEKKNETYEDDAHVEAMHEVRVKIPDNFRGLELPDWVDKGKNDARGASLYRRNCAMCHGKKGQGDGHMVSGANFKASDFSDSEHSSFYSVGEKFWIVTKGMAGMGMPPFGDRLNEEERWLLVAHILKFARTD